MLKNYLKIAVRNLKRNKIYTVINVFGFSIGIACTLFMMMWVLDELSWDRFHKNADTLFRVEMNQPNSQGLFHVNIAPYPMGPALKDELPEVANSVRVANPGTVLVRYGDKLFYEDRAAIVDPSYLEMFSFPLLLGNAESALQNPNSIVLTKEAAEKYFGKENPIGKVLIVNTKYNFTVSGILQNIPENTNLQSNILFPFSFAKTLGRDVDNWRSNEIYTWVQLYKNQNIPDVNKKITELRKRHFTEQVLSADSGKKNRKYITPLFELMPIKDLRLYEKFGYSESVGSIKNVSVLSVMALFILLIASINFMNLSTAQSAGRAREVGLRKVFGSKRSSLAIQFHAESVFLTFISASLALIFVELLIPAFNSLSGKHFTSATPLQSAFLPAILAAVLVTGIVSGIYPAFILSLFKPIEVLKGRFKSGIKGSFLRKVLVVFQFSLSIIFIIGTVAMSKQLQFMRNKNLGYQKNQLIYIPLRGETQSSYPSLKAELMNDPLIQGVSGTYQPPTYMSANGGGAEWDGKNPDFNPLIGFAGVDYDYIKTQKIEMLEGRAFSQDFPTDSVNGVLINETLAKLIGTGSVVGKKFKWANEGVITGVMKNYHFSPIQTAIEPLAVYLTPKQINFALIRLQAGNIPGSIDRIKNAWQKINPDYPLNYVFFDEDFSRMFESEEKMESLFGYASLFAIIVACMGLFGLSSFMAEQKTREIGLRKVLGASILEITALFSKEFVKWILLANIIAWPITYYLLDMLLQNYAYRIPFIWWLYPLALVLTLTTALVTVSYQSIKAARANPVDSLRYE